MSETPVELRAHVETLLRDKLAAVSVDVIDESHLHAGHAGAKSGGKHFRVTVVSAAFEGKSSLQRHRLVNEALGDLMRQRIHALALTTRTPDER